MKHFFMALLLYLTASLQFGGLFLEPWSNWEPRWIWLTLFVAIRLMNRIEILWWGACIGLCADGIGSGPLGLQMICGVMIAAWMSRGTDDFRQSRPLQFGTLALLVVLLTDVIRLSGSVLSRQDPSTLAVWQNAFKPALATAIVMLCGELARGAFMKFFRHSTSGRPFVFSTK